VTKTHIGGSVAFAATLFGSGGEPSSDCRCRPRLRTPIGQRKARDFSRRAVDSAVRVDSKETAASWQVNAALREAELGNADRARHGVAAALALSPGRDVNVFAALALARCGDASRAETLATGLEKNFPTNTILKVYWLPTVNACRRTQEE